MLITVNGDQTTLEQGATVQQLLNELGLTEGRLAVELNEEIVPRSRHSEQVLRDGDRVEVVHAIGGG